MAIILHTTRKEKIMKEHFFLWKVKENLSLKWCKLDTEDYTGQGTVKDKTSWSIEPDCKCTNIFGIYIKKRNKGILFQWIIITNHLCNVLYYL